MSPAIVGSLITGASTLSAVGLSTWLQTRIQVRRIDADNRAALAAQTGEIKQHLKGDAP